MIGTKLVLWKREFSRQAYLDQMGVWQSAYVVKKEYVVTIIETKKVKGAWGKGLYDGWKATTEDGKEFTCNWNVFPDDSITPSYFWDAVEDDDGKFWQPVDAIQACEIHLHVDEIGERKFPVNSLRCSKHNTVFLDTCWRCEYEKSKGNVK